MKKLFFVVSALAALSLLAPNVGVAQTAYNQLGIYTDQAGTPANANYTATVNVPFNAYLVLHRPFNHTYGALNNIQRAMTNVDGFECKIVFPAGGTWFKLSESFPVSAVDIGTKPDYVVGFATSVPVVNNTVVLVTFQFMALAPTKFNTFLGITDIPSIAGRMAIVDANDPTASNLQAVFPSTGAFAVPVFSVNGTDAVSTEAETWGGVKALFR